MATTGYTSTVTAALTTVLTTKFPAIDPRTEKPNTST
jgi:hypothetical protein